MNLTKRIRSTPLDELRPAEQNPRTITEEAFDRLKATLEAEPGLLELRPVIALEDGTVIAGNMRLRAAQALGWKSIPAARVTLEEAQARTWALLDNNPFGDWQEDELSEYLFELREMGADVSLTGFRKEELDALLAVAPAPDEFQAVDDHRLKIEVTHTCPKCGHAFQEKSKRNAAT